MSKEVLVVLTEYWADWEASYAIWLTNSVEKYTVKTIAMNKEPKESAGGIRAVIDYAINEYDNIDNCAMVLLTGSFTWGDDRYDDIAAFVKKARDRNIPVAAICGGTKFLAKHGFLNNIKHTGNGLEGLQKIAEYSGQDLYVEAQAVLDQGIVTANETAALEFAREVFRVLEVYDDEDMDEWYEEFKRGLVH